MISRVRMWCSVEDDLRPWAEIGEEGRGHLLAQLLHGNVYSIPSCELALETARKAMADNSYVEDLGFFDDVALYFANGRVQIEHVIAEYGVLDIEAEKLERLLSQWLRVVTSREPIELLLEIELV